MNQASVSSRKIRPRTAKMPAIAATATPLPSFAAFCETSALASSISSRTSSDAFSLISVIVSPIWGERSVLWSVAAKLLQDHREQESAGECAGNHRLGPLRHRDAAL